MLQAGDKAPNFVLKDQNDNEISLNQFRGQKILLAFYAFDWSPVCTDEMKCFGDDLEKIEDTGVKVIGISVDSAWSHKAFAKHLNIKFPLLSDFSRDVCSAYGVLRPEGFSNRAYFIVDEHGIIRYMQIMPTPKEKLDNGILMEAIRDVR